MSLTDEYLVSWCREVFQAADRAAFRVGRDPSSPDGVEDDEEFD